MVLNSSVILSNLKYHRRIRLFESFLKLHILSLVPSLHLACVPGAVCGSKQPIVGINVFRLYDLFHTTGWHGSISCKPKQDVQPTVPDLRIGFSAFSVEESL